eukprot:4323475-Lingulodinium_polyedra.AAC.1
MRANVGQVKIGKWPKASHSIANVSLGDKFLVCRMLALSIPGQSYGKMFKGPCRRAGGVVFAKQ